MAWIEVHQSLPTHRKTIHSAAVLYISPVQMVGHLVCLWLWALDNAPGCDAHNIAPCVTGWLLTCPSGMVIRRSLLGLWWRQLLVEGEDGLAIHDWHDYAGKLIEARKANRERQRRYRAAKEG